MDKKIWEAAERLIYVAIFAGFAWGVYHALPFI